jgi:hypothetical protein
MSGFGGKRPGMMEGLALLILCTLFFMLAVGAIATGVRAYTGVSALTDATNGWRTALAYISNQVRAGDAAGAVTITRIFDVDALCISEFATGDDGTVYTYRTYIYCYGGALRELYTEAGLEGDMVPEGGTDLLALDSLSLSYAEGLIAVTATVGDSHGSVLISALSGEGVAAS